MFKRKTVIVVGAGASKEVGLPTGDALKQEIAKKLNFTFEENRHFRQERISGDNKIFSVLREISKGDIKSLNEYIGACHHIRSTLTLTPSIDSFLQTHAKNDRIILCGKLAVVRCIAEKERQSKLYRPSDRTEVFDFSRIEGTWFNEFFEILFRDSSVTDIRDIFSRITLIVFNYDRCIEFSLHEAIMAYFGTTPSETVEIMKELKIIHPYGTIGQLRWRDKGPKSSLYFGEEEFDLASTAAAIKVLNEGVTKDADAEKLREEILAAQNIFFLGFGFHRENMRLLTTPARCAPSQIFTTTHGLSSSDIDVVKESVVSSLKIHTNHLSVMKFVSEPETSCFQLFRKHKRFIAE